MGPTRPRGPEAVCPPSFAHVWLEEADPAVPRAAVASAAPPPRCLRIEGFWTSDKFEGSIRVVVDTNI